MSLVAGSLIEKCTIIDTLGVGGFGITYKAWDSREGREVALKENFPSWLVRREANGGVRLTGDPNDFEWTMRHFVEEASILIQLHHKNIVHVDRAFRCNGTAYFVMEYLKAVNLGKRCHASYWTEESVRSLLTQLLQALECIHGEGIFHRDIKPANIMLRHEDDSPVLIDFGAAKSGPSLHTHTCGFVSMGYTSPEQLADVSVLSPGADIYSLGATLYCMLTGAPPPNASARLLKDDMLPLHCHGELQARFSQSLLASIDKALALEPDRRYSSAEHWLRELKSPSIRVVHPRRRTTVQEHKSQNSVRDLKPPTPPPPPPPPPVKPFDWRKVFLWSFWIGFVVLISISFTLLSSPTRQYDLDNFFPLAAFLTLVGLGGVLYYRVRKHG